MVSSNLRVLHLVRHHAPAAQCTQQIGYHVHWSTTQSAATETQAFRGAAVSARRAQVPLRALRQARLATVAAVKTDSAYTAEVRVSADSHLTDRRPPCELLRQLSLCACRQSSTAAMEAVCSYPGCL